MVKCPFCSGETKVVDKRDGEDSTRRRRECTSCEKRFTTYERPEINIMIVKKDGRREPYSREKIMAGIIKACEKRPVSLDAIERAVDKIEKTIRETDEITSREIGELIMRELRKIDKVAYIRFASVYREFDDLNAFEREVKLLNKAR